MQLPHGRRPTFFALSAITFRGGVTFRLFPADQRFCGTAKRCQALAIAMVACVLVTILSSTPVGAVDLEPTRAAEPEVAEASEEALQSLQSVRIPEDWQIQLFAAEPDVANVVALDVDRFGNVYVCETFRQNRGVTDNRAHDEEWLLADLAAQTVQDRIDYHKRLLGDAAVTYSQHDDRIRRLTDRDGDGRADESVVFADGFHSLEEGTGAGVLAVDGDVYYTCIPKLWKLTDTDGDGISDQRRAMSDGYGVRVAFRGHDLHGLTRGPDGRIYFSVGDRGYHVTTAEGRVLSDPASGAVFRCELDGSGLEVYARGLRNPQELAFNDLGDWFTVDNNSDLGDQARVVHLLRGGDSGWRMHYQYLADRGPFNRQELWKPHHDEQPAHLVPPVANLTDGPSGLAFYPGTGFGEQLRDKFLICDFRGTPATSGIRSFQLEPAGAFYSLQSDAQPIWGVLATDVVFTPTGEILVSDWVSGWEGLGKSRLYRISDPSEQSKPLVREVRQLLANDWTTYRESDLLTGLGHADRRIRLQSQWELARRNAVDQVIAAALDTTRSWQARLHALWAADQMARTATEEDSVDVSVVMQANRTLFDESEPILRAAACQVAGRRQDASSIAKLQSLLEDPSARVQYFALMALADLQGSQAGAGGSRTSSPAGPVSATSPTSTNAQAVDQTVTRAIELLATNDNQDPALRHAATRGLTRIASADRLANLADHPDVSVRRAAVAALRGQRSGSVTRFLEDADPIVIAEAALAIYDAPIPVGMDDLAGMIRRTAWPRGQDDLVRRVLAANYRLGTDDAAAALANFAASDLSPSWARVEALDSLLDWTSTDPRDRVTNELRSPTQQRRAGDAVQAVSRRIDELLLATEEVREKAIDVASQMKIAKIAPQLVQRIENEQGRPTSRGSALIALARLDADKAVGIARSIDGKKPIRLTLAALEVLGRYDLKASVPQLIEQTDSKTPAIRAAAWDWLAESDSAEAEQRIRRGLLQWLDGSLSADVHLNVLEAAEKRLGEYATNAIQKHQAALAASEPLAKWMPSLHGGDPEKGETLFMTKSELSCVRCHKVDRSGGEVGPPLTVIGKARDRRSLLESIVMPDAKISEGFETAVIADEDGQVTTGIVAEENDEYVELITADGTRQRIEQDWIIARKKGKSSMPAGLTELMTARELRDLVAYLASLQVDPRADAQTE